MDHYQGVSTYVALRALRKKLGENGQILRENKPSCSSVWNFFLYSHPDST